MCVLLFDVFKHLLLKELTFSKLAGKVHFSEKQFEKMHELLKSNKVQSIFEKTVILALLSLAAFRLQNRVSDFF